MACATRSAVGAQALEKRAGFVYASVSRAVGLGRTIRIQEKHSIGNELEEAPERVLFSAHSSHYP